MLDFLFWTLVIILILLLLAPVILAGLGVGILRHFSREMNDPKVKQERKSRFSWGASRKSKKQQTSKQKVFSEDEGVYVDFEEV